MAPALALLALLAAAESVASEPPAGEERPGPFADTMRILPGGRFIERIARERPVGTVPTAMAVSPAEQFVVTANSGPEPFALTIFQKRPRQYPYRALPRQKRGFASRTPVWHAGYSGLVFAGRHRLYASEGNSGRVRLLHIPSARVKAIIDLNGAGYEDSYSAALAYDAGRRLLYVIDEANYRLVVVDAAKNRFLSSAAVGPLPFALALSPERSTVYVTTLGMPSNSVCAIDVNDPAEPRSRACVPTGAAPGGDVVGGSGPSAVLAVGERVYVANAHNDSITVLEAATLRRVADIALRMPGFESLRGVVPVALAYHRNSHWLLAAEAGINAIAVIDAAQNRVVGHIPVAQTPRAIVVRDDIAWVLASRHQGANAGRDYAADPYRDVRIGVICMFGINYGYREGTRDLAYFRAVDPETPSAETQPGGMPYSVSVPYPTMTDSVRIITESVIRCNGFNRQRALPPLPPEIRHVVLIVRENRSFDDLLGETRRTLVHDRRAAPGFASDEKAALRGTAMAPNVYKMALRWAFADNFYSDALFDEDGQYWLAGVYPDAWTMASLPASYAGEKDARPRSRAPGRHLFFQGRLAPIQEQLPEAGTLWQHLTRHNIPFLRFQDEVRGSELVPDQQRATRVIEHLRSRYEMTGAALPRLILVHLPNSRGGVPQPAKGYPYATSYIADSDYATGRIVEYLSHSPWWRNMAIFITEDDATGGVDRIHAQRVPLVVASPYAKRNSVCHTNADFPSLLKLTLRILGVPPLNLFDATASDLSGLFAGPADFTPYEAVRPDPRVFIAAE